jgi:hypothetical protein
MESDSAHRQLRVYGVDASDRAATDVPMSVTASWLSAVGLHER